MILDLRAWCENLIIAVIITLIIELILPEGNNKKYIKVIIGLYLMVMVFDPFIDIIYKKDFSIGKSFESKYNNVVISTSQDKLIEDIYIDGIKKSIQKDLKDINESLILSFISFDEGYENITKVEIIKAIDFSDDDKIISLLEDKFSVDKSNIYIGVKG